MVFVRLYGCNLSCPWCDTKYSWIGDEYRRMDNHEVWSEINALTDYGSLTKNVCFTGGEPLLQQNDLGVLMHALHERGFRTHIETNGSIVPEGQILNVHEWVISPKDGTENGMSTLKEVYDSLLSVPTLKFVVTEKNLGVLRDIARCYPDSPIVLQPERFAFSKAGPGEQWMTPVGVYLKNMRDLVDIMKESWDGINWRVLPQLHYLLWGGVKGV